MADQPPAGGGEPTGPAAELARLDRAIDEMSSRPVESASERAALAGRIRIARRRRDALARLLAQRDQGEPVPARATTTLTAPGADPAPPIEPAPPAEPAPPPPRRVGDTERFPRLEFAPRPRTAGPGRIPVMAADRPEPPGGPRVHVEPLPPETSSRFTQTLMLALSVLLLGIAAVVFVSVISDLEPWRQLVILLAVVLLAFSVAPPVAHRGLTATAESIAAVGLLVVGIAGYALWTTGAVDLPGTTYAGLVFATTAAIGYGYHLATRLDVPRWVGLLALQPVLPLLAYPLVTGPAGWALVFTLVAVHNVGLAATSGRRPLGYAAWVLHGVAVAVALGYALAGLFLAGSLAAALPAGVMLVVAAAAGMAGALVIGREPVPTIAGAVLTIAVIIAVGRVLAVALPIRALLPATVVTALVAVVIPMLPRPQRKGPLWGVIVAGSAIAVVITGLALRAGAAAVVWPPWPDSLAAHRRELVAAALTTVGWQLAPTAAALTIAAAAAVPAVAKRESVVLGVTLTALAAPASLLLPPAPAAWLVATAAVVLAVTGLGATTVRGAAAHAAGATVTGLVAVGAALATPLLTATVLTALVVAGAVLAFGSRREDTAGGVLRQWGAGAATLLLPGATAAVAAAVGAGDSAILVAAFTGLCGSLAYAVELQLREREVPVAVLVCVLLATTVVVVVTLTLDGATLPDRLVGVVLLAAAILLVASGRLDARGGGRRLDGADLAAAALTAGVIATLARLVVLILPVSGADAALAIMSLLVFVVAVPARAVPERLRRGPVAGLAAIGGALAAVAAVAAVAVGVQVLAIPGQLWRVDLAQWWPPETTFAGLSWSPPVALVLLALAAWIVIPRGATAARVSAALAVLAVISAPPALGLAWWTPAMLSTAVGAGYVLAAVTLPAGPGLRDRPPGLAGGWPRPMLPGPVGVESLVAGPVATARATAGWVLLLYAVGASLARSVLTAAVLLVGIIVCLAVAALALRSVRRLASTTPRPAAAVADPPPVIRARVRIGGTAVAGALLGLALGLTAVAAELGQPGEVLVLTALAGASLGLAVLALLPPPRDGAGAVAFAQYLGYGTVGVTAAATGAALFALPTSHPAELYAAAAALLAVLAELLRAARTPHGYRSLVRPPVGALVAGAVPALLALVALAPALAATLLEPYQVLADPWSGPPPALLDSGNVQPSSVLAALLLTLATALAAVGFGGTVTGQAAPLIAPGLAVTLLIAPDALNAPWPAATVAALVVFTISMLGVALTPPPPVDGSTRPLRATRAVVLAIGLAAGAAGLAGALADVQLTWATLGGAVAVGMGAALGGQTPTARLLGWTGAVVAAQAFALNTAYLFEASLPQAAFALLVVATVALLAVPRLRQLQYPTAARELQVVEWLGGYGSLLLGLAFTIASPPELAGFLIATGAVLGLAALRPGHSHRWRRSLWWTAAVAEVTGWWVIMWRLDVGLLEAYTLPFAIFALVVGMLEARYRPELGSWVTWGPGLVAALAPSLIVVVTTTTPEPGRQAYVLLAGTGVLLLGYRFAQRAPLIIGSVAVAATALHMLSLAGPWLVLIPLGLLLLLLGANREKRERDLARLRGAYQKMR